MNTQIRTLMIASLLPLLTVLLASCSPVSFQAIPVTAASSGPNAQDLYAGAFKMSVSESTIVQPQLDTNETTLSFQVALSDGTQVSNLKATDFTVLENGVPVPAFKLNSNSQKIVETVDIVFVVDITGSMSSTIESAKTRLINFVKKSRTDGYHTRMCLVTFGDYTVKRCAKFYDNNPDDPATSTQVNELISEISKLSALTGMYDPGGEDLNENPLRALMDAADAPWMMGSQRFAILVTDDGFLYSPGNPGISPLATAPRYTEAMTAIANSQMKVFAATPSLPGYNTNFQGQPGLVATSKGEWFNFNSLISGSITLDTILGRILNSVQTTYTILYTAEESAGLDPSLPLSKRAISVVLKNGTVATVKLQSVQSNLPNGRESYKKKWKIADKKIRKDSVRVLLNDEVMKDGFAINDDDEIEFAQIPAAKSKIRVHYQYKELKDALLMSQVALPKEFTELALGGKLIVELNSQKAKAQDIKWMKTLEGNVTLEFDAHALSEDDPYRIRENSGLTISVRAP